MTLRLVDKKVFETEVEMPCDVSKDFFEMFDKLDDVLKSRLLELFWTVRKFKIKAGEKYVHYEFVDEDGELHEINCLERLDSVMRKYKLYPSNLPTGNNE